MLPFGSFDNYVYDNTDLTELDRMGQITMTASPDSCWSVATKHLLKQVSLSERMAIRH